MNINLMVLDNNPASREAIITLINSINNFSDDEYGISSLYDTDNFRDAVDYISRNTLDIIIVNISSINLERYKEDCIQLRSIYSYAPILALSESPNPTDLKNFDYVGFDDILDINLITPRMLLRVIVSGIQRSINYHSFHTSNQRKLISSSLLELLLDKKNLTDVAQSACQIINSQSSRSSCSSASIYTVHQDKVECIAHAGTHDSDDVMFEFQKEIFTIKHSFKENDTFKYYKKKIDERTRFTIPLNNNNSIFSFLKIEVETQNIMVHLSEEESYYQNMSQTLSDIFILAKEREHFEQVYQQNLRLINEMSSAAIGINKHDCITHWNHQAEKYFGYSSQQALGKRLFDLGIQCDWPTLISKLYDSLNLNTTTDRFDVIYKRSDAEKDRILSVAITPFSEANGMFMGYLLLMDDITEKKYLEKKHQQSMYLESIGQLSAGIAHEINTPMQYISDNLNFLRDSFTDTAKALNKIQKNLINKTLDEEMLSAIFEAADFDYLSEELPLAFNQTTEGVNRVCNIVKAMKEYSHPNSEHKVATNINHCIESTIIISKHTWKYHSELDLDLDPELPLVMCHPGPFNEVILNLIVNAADAIKEAVENNSEFNKGKILIQTLRKESYAEIRISDTGGGIPVEIQEKIFDPFFTTKDVGKGTGQGLALSYRIIKERHNGELFFETVSGEGTTFILQLPYTDTES